jgi:hypothetical protein
MQSSPTATRSTPMSDVTGKQFSDLVSVRPNPLQIGVWPSTGETFEQHRVLHNEPYDYSSYKFLLGDVNGNKKADVVAIAPNDGGTIRFVVWVATADGFAGGGEWGRDPYNYSAYRFRLGAVTGDGQADVIGIDPNDNGAIRIVVWKSTGSSFQGGVEWGKDPYDYSAYQFFVGDVNADQRVDVIGINPNDSGSIRFVVWVSDDKRFSGGAEWGRDPYDYSAYRFLVGDVTGTGTADVVGINPDENGNIRFVVWTSSGAAFSGGVEWGKDPYNYSAYEFFIADVNGDGRADVVGYEPNQGRIVVWRSTGSGFTGGGEWLQQSHPEGGYLIVGDLDSPALHGTSGSLGLKGFDTACIGFVQFCRNYELQNGVKKYIGGWYPCGTCFGFRF